MSGSGSHPGPAVGEPGKGEWQGNLALLMPLLAFGLLVHKTLLPEPLTVPWPVLSPLLAVLVLLRPRSRPLGIGLAVVLCLEIAWFWPDVVNHAVLVFFMGAATVGVVGVEAIRTGARDGSRSGERSATTEDRLFPILRGGVYVLFAFAVLHKLNHGFLDPRGSCAVDHYEQLRERIGLLPAARAEWFRHGVIWITLGSEAVIPLLLWRRRTRRLGLWLAFGFHAVMGVNGHHTFSGFAPAMYVPFLPSTAHLMGRASPGAARWLRVSRGTLLVLGGGMAGLVLAGGAVGRPYLAYELGWVSFYALFALVALAPVALGSAAQAPAARGRPGAGAPALPRGHAPRGVAFVCIGALVANAASPYFGLRTEIAFSMFSNLRTEGEEWNHLFLPSGLRRAPFQDSLVSVESISAPESRLAWHAGRNEALVPLMAAELAAEACRDASSPIRARFRVGDRVVESDDLCAEAPLGAPAPWWQRKLLSFRALPVTNVCRH